MQTFFNEDWKQWIRTNVNAGRDKNGIFKILLDEGYSFDAIAAEMNFVPTLPVNQLVNPLHAANALKAKTINNISPNNVSPNNVSPDQAQSIPDIDTDSIHQRIPNYHPTGFEKATMAPRLFDEICAFYQTARTAAEEEFVPGEFIVNQHQRKKSSVLVDLSSSLRQKIHDYMMPILGDWCGKPLEPTYVYGIRTYLDGAKLKSHRDRIETHIISAIINVAQQVNEPWPLVIDDHQENEHKVYLKPGEMIFYEGAKLQHGRPIPFNGVEFANIFCHFKPVDYTVPK